MEKNKIINTIQFYLLASQLKTVADFFIEADKPIYTKAFLEIADFVKNNDLYSLNKNRFKKRKKGEKNENINGNKKSRKN